MAKSEYKPGNNRLTNNFRANIAILLTFIFAAIILHYMGIWTIQNTGLFNSKRSFFNDLLIHAGLFSAIYIFTSFWFSPDIDIRRNRPGKKSFPFGPLVKLLHKIQKSFGLLRVVVTPTIAVLQIAHVPLNYLWNLWTAPFGLLFTHRGVMHWPFVGSLIKLFYLQYSCYFLSYLIVPIIDFTGLFSSSFLSPLNSEWLYNFIKSGSLGFALLAGVLLADICHTAIDYYDAVRNGNKNFIPPEFIAPRGLLLKFLKFLGRVLSLGK